jgi:hypothetical protein
MVMRSYEKKEKKWVGGSVNDGELRGQKIG